MDQSEDTTNDVSRSPVIHLAPVLPREGPIDRQLDCLLAHIATTARHGDRTARDSLYWAVVGRLEPSMRRLYRLHVLTYGQGMVELEDVQQSSYLVFADMIASWEPDESFVRYLFGMFHWRLRYELRAYAKRRETVMPVTETVQPSEAAASAAALERLLRRLPERQQRIVQLRLRRDLSFIEIGAILGVSPRTIKRDLHAIEQAVLDGWSR
jgi:RNA polymerase sigma factor (sigma-70 family)